MKKRIEAKLDCMINWLNNEKVSYNKQDFKKDIDRLLDAIYEARFNDIITIKQATELHKLVINKACDILGIE